MGEGGSELPSCSAQWPVPLRGLAGVAEQTATGSLPNGLYNHGLLQSEETEIQPERGSQSLEEGWKCQYDSC